MTILIYKLPSQTERINRGMLPIAEKLSIEKHLVVLIDHTDPVNYIYTAQCNNTNTRAVFYQSKQDFIFNGTSIIAMRKIIDRLIDRNNK